MWWAKSSYFGNKGKKKTTYLQKWAINLIIYIEYTQIIVQQIIRDTLENLSNENHEINKSIKNCVALKKLNKKKKKRMEPIAGWKAIIINV